MRKINLHTQFAIQSCKLTSHTQLATYIPQRKGFVRRSRWIYLKTIEEHWCFSQNYKQFRYLTNACVKFRWSSYCRHRRSRPAREVVKCWSCLSTRQYKQLLRMSFKPRFYAAVRSASLQAVHFMQCPSASPHRDASTTGGPQLSTIEPTM